MNALQIYFKNSGLTVLPDTAQWINRFEINSSSSNRVYTIAQRSNKREWACSCPGWIRHRHCKHLSAVMPMINSAEQATKSQTHELAQK